MPTNTFGSRPISAAKLAAPGVIIAPGAKSAANSPSSNTTRPLRRVTIIVTAGKRYDLPSVGNQVFLKSCTAAAAGVGQFDTTCIVTTDTGSSFILENRNDRFIFETPYNVLTFDNSAGANDITIIAYVGFGSVRSVDVQPVSGFLTRQSVIFTRPNDVIPYTAGDCLSDSTVNPKKLSFTAARTFCGTGAIVKARIVKSTATVANAAFRLYVFSGQPANDKPDNVQCAFDWGTDLDELEAVIDFPVFTVDGAGTAAFCEVADLSHAFQCLQTQTTKTLSGTLLATAPYVPGAQENFRVELYFDQN